MKKAKARPDLKKYREKHQLTQEQAAEKIGVDQATVWRWENRGLPTRGLGLKALDRFLAKA